MQLHVYAHVHTCITCRVEIEAEIRRQVDDLMREELKNLKLVSEYIVLQLNMAMNPIHATTFFVIISFCMHIIIATLTCYRQLKGTREKGKRQREKKGKKERRARKE